MSRGLKFEMPRGTSSIHLGSTGYRSDYSAACLVHLARLIGRFKGIGVVTLSMTLRNFFKVWDKT